MNGLNKYDAPSKESHRGWLFNRLSELIHINRDSRLLYLCGPEDVDRCRAISKGFANHNIIAVDTKDVNIRQCRKNGGVGVAADVRHVLHLWNDRPFDAILLDTCSTVPTVMEMINAAISGRAVHHETVFYCNMQRGREKMLGWQIRGMNDIIGMHRGRWLMSNVIHQMWHSMSGRFGHTVSPNSCVPAWFVKEVLLWCRPSFHNYKSSSVEMDSVIFVTPAGGTVLPTKIGPKTERKVRAKLAARLAVHNRMQGGAK